MPGFKWNDGGRSTYLEGQAGDCVTRAIAIATGADYSDVWHQVAELVQAERGEYTADEGASLRIISKVLDSYGWHAATSHGWGSLELSELISHYGTFVADISDGYHVIAVIDGVVQDTWDSRLRENATVCWDCADELQRDPAGSRPCDTSNCSKCNALLTGDDDSYWVSPEREEQGRTIWIPDAAD